MMTDRNHGITRAIPLALIVCSRTVFEEGSLWSIIQAFSTVTAPAFPYMLRQMSVYAVVGKGSRTPERFDLHVITPSGSTAYRGFFVVHEWGAPYIGSYAWELNDFTFEVPGDYLFRLFDDVGQMIERKVIARTEHQQIPDAIERRLR